MLKYEDNFKAIRLAIARLDPAASAASYQYNYNREEMMCRIADLYVPWHPVEKKGDPEFVPITTFIGFLWDFDTHTVALPEEKRLKFLKRVRLFSAMYKAAGYLLPDVQKIHGSLCHVAFVHREGASHLPAFSNFTSKFKFCEFHRLHLPTSVKSEAV